MRDKGQSFLIRLDILNSMMESEKKTSENRVFKNLLDRVIALYNVYEGVLFQKKVGFLQKRFLQKNL